jgi:hypothetical protein
MVMEENEGWGREKKEIKLKEEKREEGKVDNEKQKEEDNYQGRQSFFLLLGSRMDWQKLNPPDMLYRTCSRTRILQKYV